MNEVDEILTDGFQEKVVWEFLKLHREISEEAHVRLACEVLIDYCRVPGYEDDREDD